MPLPWVRLGGYGLLAFALGNLAAASGAYRRALLLGALVLAYVFAPYWRTPIYAALPGGPAAAWALLLAACGVLAWYHAAPGDGGGVRPVATWREGAGWLALLGAAALLQLHALFADVPWRGDEAFHLLRWSVVPGTVRVALAGSGHGAGAALAALLAAALALRGALAAGWLAGPLARAGPLAGAARALCGYGWVGAAAAWWAVAAGPALPAWTGFITRYPAASLWPPAPLGWSGGASPLAAPWWVRVGSLAGFAACAGLVFSWTWRRCGDGPLALAAGLWFLTLPTAAFHAATGQIEPYLLPLETAVLLWPGFLFAPSARALREAPGNAALCGFALLKETALPLLAVVGALRVAGLARRARAARRVAWRAAGAEAAYLALLGAVALPYMVARLGSGERAYVFTPGHWLRGGEYLTFARSLWEQTGLLAPLAAVGLAWGLAGGGRRAALAGGGTVAAYALFYLGDRNVLLGYARFNLLVVPGLLCLALPLLAPLRARSRGAALALLAAGVAVNLALSPLDWRAGVPRPVWDRMRPAADTPYFFPTRATVDWLRERVAARPGGAAGARIALYQHDYHLMGFDRVYAETPGLPPLGHLGRRDRRVAWARAHEAEALANVLRVAAARRVTLLIYPCLNGTRPPALPPAARRGFRVAAVLDNGHYALAVFEREAAP